jgi:hypothetical protein
VAETGVIILTTDAEAFILGSVEAGFFGWSERNLPSGRQLGRACTLVRLPFSERPSHFSLSPDGQRVRRGYPQRADLPVPPERQRGSPRRHSRQSRILRRADRWVGIMCWTRSSEGRPPEVGKSPETKAAGGYLNASTTYDHTSYVVALPVSAPAAIDIQSDALQHSLIVQELRRELGVVIQEARRSWIPQPRSPRKPCMKPCTTGTECGAAHWARGSRSSPERTCSGTTIRYVPSRTIVGIVGDVDPEAALDLARAAYGMGAGLWRR